MQETRDRVAVVGKVFVVSLLQFLLGGFEFEQ